MKFEKIQELYKIIEKSGYFIVEVKEETKKYDGFSIDDDTLTVPIISLKITTVDTSEILTK
jgi:hypothetical protein